MINIVILGGTYNTNNYFHYLTAKNDMVGVRIFVIHRHCPEKWLDLDKHIQSICPNTEIYEDCNTTKMYEILKRSHYMLFISDIEKFIHTACSGAIGAAFGTGCTMIMPRIYNTDYKFKNALFFEDLPTLTRTPDLDTIFEEQDEILRHNTAVLDSMFEV
jgi:hypothetical protein